MAQTKKNIRYIDKNGYGFFAVERKDIHQFIGFTGLFKPAFDDHFTPCIEIGWQLREESWQKALPQRQRLPIQISESMH